MLFQTFSLRVSALTCWQILLCWHLAAQTALKTPNQFLPHALGEQFTPHHLVTDYYEYLAANAPATVRLEKYGQTVEARPLQIAIFSSPDNMRQLEQIRLHHLSMTGLHEGTVLTNTQQPIAIVWISMSVHGNEPSGAEVGMLLAHRLAAQSDAEARRWLSNTVVIIDVTLNPDGYDRYVHWNRMVSNKMKTPVHEAREHHEPWPGGRLNHYHFDMNRDWAWATQSETRQRLAAYHRWMPHVHPDIHEQGIDEPYYFAPAAEPLHEYITDWQRSFQVTIGKNNAQKFDQNGWLYFTKEVFDLFYPSYGDTYPMFNGSIGMTYEQAGGPPAGRAVIIESGDTLTLHDRIAHHLTTCLSTIEVSSQHAKELVDNYKKFFRDAVTKPQGQYKTYIIKNTNDANKIANLCRLLDIHQIKYGRAATSTASLKGFDYVEGREKDVAAAPGDLIISAFQPKSVLVQVLFDPEAKLSDSLTYDITAWSLPFAHGLEGFATRTKIEPTAAYEYPAAPDVMLTAAPYAWCVQRRSLNDMQFLGDLLQKGVKVRYATHDFEVGTQKMEAGTLVISRGDNRQPGEGLDGWVKAAAHAHQVTLMPVFSGFMDKGKDMGSDALPIIPAVNAALVYDDDVDAIAYGQVWHFFEQELQYPITPIALNRLNRVRLGDYSTLILPDGNYSFSDAQIKNLQEWVREGGRLIASEGAMYALANREEFAVKTKESPKKEGSSATTNMYVSRERDRLSDNLPGAIVCAVTDPTHPLTYGIGKVYFSMKTSPEALELTDQATAVIQLDSNYKSYGFIGYRLKSRLKKTVIAGVQPMGNGQIVYFTDNPLFRSFWQQGKLLFTNALFF
jgi:hypothetical protein